VEWGLPERRTGAAAGPDLVAQRAAIVARPVPATAAVTVEPVELGGVTTVVCEPERPTAALVYFHGGGFRLGTAAMSAAFGARLADAAGVRVIAVEYALAPEQPFPAALHDAAAAYEAALARWREPVLVGGDSAGGGLAAALTAAVLRAQAPGNTIAAPSGLILLSPWLDLTVGAPSYESRAATDPLFSRARAIEAAELYLQGWDPCDPLASPLFAELEGFPSTLLFAAAGEVLVDDAIGLAGRLAAAGVTVHTHLVAGMQHVWPTIAPDHPESGRAVAEIARFVHDRVGVPELS
jgi:epsilon-lactone hydrolase